MTPLMVRLVFGAVPELPATPMDTSLPLGEGLPRITLPDQVLLPLRLYSAPKPPTPESLRTSNSLATVKPKPVVAWSWSIPVLVRLLLTGVVNWVVPPLPRALALVIFRMPAEITIGPVKALLSLDRTRMPTPSLVSCTPLVPLSLPDMVRSAPALTVKNCRLPEAPPILTLREMVSPVAF